MIVTTESDLARKGVDAARDPHDQPGPSTNQLPQDELEIPDELTEHDGLLAHNSDSYPDTTQGLPLGSPPAFAPYEAEWFEVGDGDVVSHDEHLNTDGEALYRFLLTQAKQRSPSYRVRCTGSHTETRHRWVSPYDNHDHDHHHHHHHHHHHNNQGHQWNGGSSTRTETYSERVVDFDFCIDITPSVGTPLPPSLPFDSKAHVREPLENQDDLLPIHWSVADNEPAYRGRMVREVELGLSSFGRSPSLGNTHLLSPTSTFPSRCRKASRRECKDYDKWVEQRTNKGLPPWVSGINGWNITAPTEHDVLRSSKSLREWADEYCASQKLLKEFLYTKVLYGWDISQLETAIRSTITLAPYHGNIDVSFQPINSRIYVRPSNRLSRALSNKWLKFLSIILWLFPFIWLFKRFHSKGGGRWQVCGGAYALKKWVPLSSNQNQYPNTCSHPNAGNSSGSGSNELPAYEDIASPSTSTSIFASSFPIPGPSSPFSPSSRIPQTRQGPHKLVGQREGEWFRHWEPLIIRAVLMRYQAITPLTSHSELYGRLGGPGSTLEGYHEEDVGPGQPVISNRSEFNGRSGAIFLP